MEVRANQIIGLVRRGEVPTGKTEQWAAILRIRRWLKAAGTVALLSALVVMWWTDPTLPTWGRVKSTPGIVTIGLMVFGGAMMFITDRPVYRNAHWNAYDYLVHYYRALAILGIDAREFMSWAPEDRQVLSITSLRILATKVSVAEGAYKRDKTSDADRKHADARTKFRDAFETFAFLELIDRKDGYGPFFVNAPV